MIRSVESTKLQRVDYASEYLILGVMSYEYGSDHGDCDPRRVDYVCYVDKLHSVLHSIQQCTLLYR